MTEQLKFLFSDTSFTKAELALLTPEDIYANADQHLLELLKEDRRIERKPAGIHGAELGTYFSMWANTVGGGLMVIGQEDNGLFSGVMKLSQNDINTTEKAGEAHCPDAYIQHRRVPVTLPDGNLDFALLIYVHYHEKRVVRDVKGKVYRRTGDSREEVRNPDKISCDGDRERAGRFRARNGRFGLSRRFQCGSGQKLCRGCDQNQETCKGT